MRVRTIVTAAFGLIALCACSGDDEADKIAAAPRGAADTAGSVPAVGPATPADQRVAAEPDQPADGLSPGQSPPTLPTEPAMTSPATSPPPQ